MKKLKILDLMNYKDFAQFKKNCTKLYLLICTFFFVIHIILIFLKIDGIISLIIFNFLVSIIIYVLNLSTQFLIINILKLKHVFSLILNVFALIILISFNVLIIIAYLKTNLIFY